MTVFRIIPVAILLAACGCAQHTSPIVTPAELTPVEKNFQAVWDATVEVLSSYRFSVDRRDRRSGVITTEPMVSRHFFEWWRKDKATASGALENTIQPIYRQVLVQILKTDKGKYYPVVSVTVSRLLAEDDRPSNRDVMSREQIITPGRQDRLVLAAVSSDKTRGDPGKHSPDDELLAVKLSEDIRRLADKKRAVNTP